MSAPAALAVVKQIQAIADGPKTEEMRGCMGQVVSSLLFFLDHPDNRVRLNAARTLLKLSSSYKTDIFQLDLKRARATLSRCRREIADGTHDQGTKELYSVLAEFLGEDDASTSASTAATASSASSSGYTDSPSAPPRVDGRGQVVLKVADETNIRARSAILEKVVALSGALSVTFEGPYVIVNTRTPEVASDAAFLADLLTAVKSEGLQGISLVSSGAVAASTPVSPTHGGTAGNAGGAGSAAAESDDDEEGGAGGPAPGYLDEPEEANKAEVGDVGAGGLSPGGAPHWSFFAQTNWMATRRVQEYGDDPSVAARLAKAKQREEEEQQEARSKLGRLSSWLSGRR